MGWCPSNQVDGPARGYGTMSRESKCEAILSVDKLPSTLNLEFKGLVNPADQHKGKTFLFIEDVCGLAFDARRELINN